MLFVSDSPYKSNLKVVLMSYRDIRRHKNSIKLLNEDVLKIGLLFFDADHE